MYIYNMKMPSYQYNDFHYKMKWWVFPLMKIRRSHDRLIFIKEISIPGKMVFILKQGPAGEAALQGVGMQVFLHNAIHNHNKAVLTPSRPHQPPVQWLSWGGWRIDGRAKGGMVRVILMRHSQVSIGWLLMAWLHMWIAQANFIGH